MPKRAQSTARCPECSRRVGVDPTTLVAVQHTVAPGVRRRCRGSGRKLDDVTRQKVKVKDMRPGRTLFSSVGSALSYGRRNNAKPPLVQPPAHVEQGVNGEKQVQALPGGGFEQSRRRH